MENFSTTYLKKQVLIPEARQAPPADSGTASRTKKTFTEQITEQEKASVEDERHMETMESTGGSFESTASDTISMATNLDGTFSGLDGLTTDLDAVTSEMSDLVSTLENELEHDLSSGISTPSPGMG